MHGIWYRIFQIYLSTVNNSWCPERQWKPLSKSVTASRTPASEFKVTERYIRNNVRLWKSQAIHISHAKCKFWFICLALSLSIIYTLTMERSTDNRPHPLEAVLLLTTFHTSRVLSKQWWPRERENKYTLIVRTLTPSIKGAPVVIFRNDWAIS